MKIRELDHPWSHENRARSLLAGFTAIVIAASALAVAPTIAHAAETPTIASARLQWAVKSQLNTYVLNSQVPGSITTLGSNTSTTDWADATGSASQQGDSADISFGVGNGKKYQGYTSPKTGIDSLNISITNPRVQMTSATTGKLYVDIAGINFTMDDAAPSVPFVSSGEHFANITATAPTITGNTITWDRAKTTITETGASRFSALLKAGAELDPITLSVTLNSLESPKPAQEPASTPTPTPTPEQIPAPAPTPEQIPAQDIAARQSPESLEGACGTHPAIAGSVNWLIKESFINYLTKILPDGSYTGGIFTVTDGSVTQNNSNISGAIRMTGDFHATGHHGVLDLKLSDPFITFNGTNTASLSAVMHSNDISGKPIDGSGTRVDIATLDVTGLAITGNSIFSQGAAASLTDAGAKAFANFYKPGEALDPVPLYIVLGTSIPCVSPEQVIPETPVSHAVPLLTPVQSNTPALQFQSHDSLSSSGRTDHTKPMPIRHMTAPEHSAHTPSIGTLAQQPSQKITVPTLPAPETCVARAVTAGSINWLIRASFINYLGKSFVGGSYSGGTFTVTGGSINSKNGITGNIRTSGEFHATGHEGKLDLKFSNLDIKFNGSNTAVLSAVMSSTDKSGTPTPNSGKRVDIATLDISGLSVQGNTLSSNGAPTALTAAGSEAFAGYYNAGEALDPVPFTVTLGANVPCDSFSDPGSPANSGKLAVTGTDAQASTIALIALLMMLTGAGISRARRSRLRPVNN